MPAEFDEETKAAAEAMAAGYLESQTAAVRNHSIPWDGYQTAGLIEKAELAMINSYDGSSWEKKNSLWKENGREYASLMLALLSKLNNDEPLQYVLTLVDDALTTEPTRVTYFHAMSTVSPGQPYGCFLHLCMEKSDVFIQNKAVKILAALCVTGPVLDDNSADRYLKWLAAQLRSGSGPHTQVVMKSLMSMLRFDQYRIKFYEDTDGVMALCELVRNKAANFQMQYQVVFCFWLMTFNTDIAQIICKRHVPAVIANVLSKSNKEKVVRVSILTLRNILEKSGEKIKENVENMVSNKLVRLLRMIQAKNWKDEDIKEDVEWVVDTMTKYVQDMNSFDEYAAEVRSGDLKWSAMHKSTTFWRDHVMRLNDNEHEMLRTLITLLDASADPLVLAVACHDLGEYTRHYNLGRVNVEELGGKSALIKLISHQDSSVRYEALIATQKMMVQNWNFLSKSIGN
eukprot:CFRG0994T1